MGLYDDPYYWDSPAPDEELVLTPLPSSNIAVLPLIAAQALTPGGIDEDLFASSFESQSDPNDIWGTNTAPSTTSGKTFLGKALDFFGKLLGGNGTDVHPSPSMPGPSGTKTINYTQKSPSQLSQSGSMIGGLSIGAVAILAGLALVMYMIVGKSK